MKEEINRAEYNETAIKAMIAKSTRSGVINKVVSNGGGVSNKEEEEGYHRIA